MQFAVFVALLLLVAGRTCSAQMPQPCTSPPMSQGSFVLTSQNAAYSVMGNYFYDAIGQRVRYQSTNNIRNETTHTDILQLFQEGVMYVINEQTRSCNKFQLTSEFHPVKVPSSAKFISQVVLGTLSASEAGMLVNVWAGELPQNDVHYISTITDVGCIFVSCVAQTPKTGGIVISTYNTVIGIENPEVLLPPSFCENLPLENEERDFFSSFS